MLVQLRNFPAGKETRKSCVCLHVHFLADAFFRKYVYERVADEKNTEWKRLTDCIRTRENEKAGCVCGYVCARDRISLCRHVCMHVDTLLITDMKNSCVET